MMSSSLRCLPVLDDSPDEIIDTQGTNVMLCISLENTVFCQMCLRLKYKDTMTCNIYTDGYLLHNLRLCELVGNQRHCWLLHCTACTSDFCPLVN